MNECEKEDACGDNQRCSNSDGSYTCTCLEGFDDLNSDGNCEGEIDLSPHLVADVTDWFRLLLQLGMT